MIKLQAKLSTFFNEQTFAPAAPTEKEIEEAKIMELLGRFSGEMLKDFLRDSGGHPTPEWGDGETWRFYYLDECSRRGRRLLEQLGWPSNDEAKYINIHTGSVGTLLEISDKWHHLRDEIDPVADQVWSTIELWEPYSDERLVRFRGNYLKENIQSLKKRIERNRDGPTVLKSNKNTLKRYEEELKTIQGDLN